MKKKTLYFILQVGNKVRDFMQEKAFDINLTEK